VKAAAQKFAAGPLRNAYALAVTPTGTVRLPVRSGPG
jgi:hypothetical protein